MLFTVLNMFTKTGLQIIFDVAQSSRLFATPWTGSPPGSSVHEISQARIPRGLPFPSPGDLPNSGVEPGSPALQADSLPTELQGKPPSNDCLQMLRIFKKFVTFSEESSRGSTKLCSAIIV